MSAATDLSTPSPTPDGEAQLTRALVRMAIVSADQQTRFTALAGGVSSDIYRVDLPARVVCVKRALARLKVAADWQVPVARNRWEVEWMRVAAGIVPHAVPEILGEDPEAGAFAMAFLPPDRYPVWKALLADGRGTAAMAMAVGDTLGRIHAATADRPEIAARFPTDAVFPRHPPRAVPRHRGAYPPGSGGAFARPRGHHGSDQACAGARRLQSRKTSSSAPTGRSSSTPNARGMAIPPSTWRSCSTTCC